MSDDAMSMRVHITMTTLNFSMQSRIESPYF